TSTPGVAVARAYVGVGGHPGYPCDTVPGAVTVRVLPAAGTQPDPGLLDAVRAHLEQARLVGTELFVSRPRYRRARLRVDLTGRPARYPAQGPPACSPNWSTPPGNGYAPRSVHGCRRTRPTGPTRTAPTRGWRWSGCSAARRNPCCAG